VNRFGHAGVVADEQYALFDKLFGKTELFGIDFKEIGTHFVMVADSTFSGIMQKRDEFQHRFGVFVQLLKKRFQKVVIEPVEYGEWGRVELTTLTKEFFMPRFLERDEAIRREPIEQYPWDGVGEVRPFGALTKKIVEGVY
jgi:hypothetical protein